MSPGEVSTADVVAILKQELKDEDGNPVGGTLWNSMPETASRLRGRIEKIIAAFKVTSGQQDKFNPAQWTGHLDAVFPKKSKVRKVEHHAALPYAEVPALMKELGKREGLSALALKFLVLTAARTGEVLGARWREINVGKRRWSIPAERMKMEREHVVPLSDAALAVLAKVEGQRIDGNDAVFPGGTWVDDKHATMSNMALLVLLKRLRQPREEEPDGWTLKLDCTAHGFRSSFRDWCAESGHDRELAEAALAHSVGNAVEAAYKRSQMVERRAPLMAAWAAHCTGQTGGGKVIAMTGRKRKTS